VTAPTAAQIAAVLAEHVPVPCAHHTPAHDHWWFQCGGCVWQSMVTTERDLAYHEDAHRAHVAAVLAALFAERDAEQRREAIEEVAVSFDSQGRPNTARIVRDYAALTYPSAEMREAFDDLSGMH